MCHGLLCLWGKCNWSCIQLAQNNKTASWWVMQLTCITSLCPANAKHCIGTIITLQVGFLAKHYGIALQNMYTGVAHCRMCARVCKTCTRRGAKSVTCTRRGGSLQVSASAQEQLSPTSRSFSPQPILPRHHHQQIIGVFQTKTFPPPAFRQSPDILVAW